MSVLIVGAGLSGLCSAQMLAMNHPGLKILILEGRSRMGGRIFTDNEVDLGAAWTWETDRELRGVLSSNKVDVLPQHSAGEALYHASVTSVVSAGHNQSPSGNSARIVGGGMSLINSLTNNLPSDRVSIKMGSIVEHVEEVSREGGETKMEVRVRGQGESRIETADFVILALPPRLISHSITFNPPLPSRKKKNMASTPTWMEKTGKVAFIYASPFWRSRGLSGTVFSRTGPLRQIWDNSNLATNSFALAGETLFSLYIYF